MTKEEKNKEIKSKLNKLNKIFKSIPDDRKVVVADLIQNCAFIAVELEDLQELIKEQGSVEHYQNGMGPPRKVAEFQNGYVGQNIANRFKKLLIPKLSFGKISFLQKISVLERLYLMEVLC